MRDPTDVWARHATQWSRVGPPLRPGPQDAEALRRLSGPPPRQAPVLVLGLTLEILRAGWLADHELLAVDHSAAMWQALWKTPAAPSRSPRLMALRADWRALPLAGASVGRVLGDGSLNALAGPRDARCVLAELHRVLQPGQCAVLRCFVRDGQAGLPTETLVDEVAAGQVGSFDGLKWRLAMRLADPASGSVAVCLIASTFDALFPDRGRLARHTAWPRECIDAIDAYHGSDTHYHFPTLEALRNLAAPGFALESVHTGNYELARQCPTVRLARRGADQAP